MQDNAAQEKDLGATEQNLLPTARAAQKIPRRSGEYLCEQCRTQFKYKASEKDISCPHCRNANADTVTPIYVADDPQETEMLSKDEFSAGD